MKKYILFSIIAFVSLLTAASAWGAINCDQSSVQTAINNASNGDTITCNAGNWTWNNVITINAKAITLQGAGIDQTNIIATQGCSSTNYAGAIQITAHATQNTRVSGFTFTDSASCLFGVSGAYNNAGKVRLDHIKFNSGLATFVRWKNNQPGLIDHNIFPGYGGAEKMQIDASAEAAASWARTDNMGSGDQLYIEDNTFNCLPNNTCMVSNAWGGARFVVRHNTLVNATVDGHGQDYWNYSVRQMEIYDNTWTQMQGAAAIYFRGGTGVIFNNTAPSGTWGTGLLIYEICREAYTGCCTTYPCIQQVGRGQNYGSSPVYLWNNTNLAVWHSCGGQFDCPGMDDSDAATFIQINRDYYASTKSGYTPYSYPHPCQNNWPACSGTTPVPFCGDSSCNGEETCSSCPADCGICPSPIPLPAGGIQAESGTLVSPMQIVSDSSASGGSYIQTNIVEQGTASYSFNIASAGTYKIVARVYAADSGQDSFYFKIDNLAEDVWDLNPTGAANEFNVWREDEITKRGTGTFDAPQYDPYTVNLTSGNHTLTFRGREINARLDYFYLVKITDTTPPAAPTGVVVN